MEIPTRQDGRKEGWLSARPYFERSISFYSEDNKTILSGDERTLKEQSQTITFSCVSKDGSVMPEIMKIINW